MKIGVLQFKPRLMDLKGNLAKIEGFLKDLDKNSVDLVVLPELATSGYLFRKKEELKTVSESPPTGLSFQFFSCFAEKLNCAFVYGFPEIEGENFYNSCAIVFPNKSFLVYRKIHLFYEEKLFFKEGNKGRVLFEFRGVIFGVIICFDWIFPELTRSLALEGVQVILHPSNLVLPWGQLAMRIRAVENRIFTVTVNRVGLEKRADRKLKFTGMSQVISPRGEILLKMGKREEGLKVVEIDPYLANDKWITSLNNIFEDRKTEFYLT